MDKVNLSEQIRHGLAEWAGEAHSARFLTFYLKLLEIQAEVEGGLALPEIKLSRQELEERLRSGRPVFAFEELALDWPLVNRTFHRVAVLFAGHPEVLGPVPEALLASDFALPGAWAQAWFEGEDLPPEIDGAPLEPVLLGSLIQQTLRPFLIGYGQVLAGRYDQDVWRRPFCPVCGSDPEFSYLDKENAARWLLCATCCAEWQYQRTQCPFCGTADIKALSYLTGDNELYRLYLCQRCKSYLKAIDLRKTTEKKHPALESLTTLALDRQAQEMGYHRGDSHREPVN